MKTSIIERFDRTIKRKIYEQFILRGIYKWVDITQHLVDEYNERRHRTIKMAPEDVNSENEQEHLNTITWTWL